MRFRPPAQGDQSGSAKGFTLVELVVCIAIVVTLLCLVLPAIQLAQISSDRTQCASNLRQIGIAYHAFLDGHTGKTAAFKGDADWINELKKYVENRDEIFICTADMRDSNPMHPGDILQPTAPPDINVIAETLLVDWTDRLVVVVPQTGGGFSLGLVSTAPDQSGDGKLSGIKASDLKAKPIPLPISRPPASGAKTSYGVSGWAEHFGIASDGQKVLAVEYHKVVVNIFGSGAMDFWPTDAAPRHNGMLNAVYKGGHVQSYLHYDIDPRETANYKLHWVPEMKQSD